jgi:putative ABC transport system permease protein
MSGSRASSWRELVNSTSMPVLDAAVFGPLRYAPGRAVVAVIAIALGVALGSAIYFINRSAANEVALAAHSLYGLADLAVQGAADDFDEAVYATIARAPGVAAASPVVEVDAKLVGRRGVLRVSGVDGFRSGSLQPSFARLAGTMSNSSVGLLDPQAMFLSASAAGALAVAVDDFIEFQVGARRVRFRVAGVLPASALRDRVGVVDIAIAQQQFERLGKLSRIDLRLAPGADVTRVRRGLSATLPAGMRVVTPGEAADDALRLSRAYRSNLTALALVALFTGGFFVYSTQSIAELRRRREFAVLHALGVTRVQQLWLTLFGGALVGVCGAIVGVLAGIAVAKFGLGALGADLGAGYFRGLAPQLEVRWLEVSVFCLLGAGVALVGTLRPALDSTRVPTASALKSGDVTSADLQSRRSVVIALVAVAAAALLLPPIGDLPLPGYASIAMLIVATVVALPSLMSALLRRLPKFRYTPFEVAVAQLRGTARYATLSVAAVVVSFSLMVAMAIMVTSFRTSLDLWLQKVLPADIYVRAGYSGQSSYFDERSIAALHRLPGVERLESSRFAQVSLSADRPPVTLIARGLDADRVADVLWLEATTDESVPSGAVPVWVSEAAADLFDLRAGGSVDFDLAGRRVTAFVRGVWRDYENQNGAIAMERETYARLTGDTSSNTVWLWLAPNASEQSVRDAVREALPPGMEYDLRTPRELRRLSLQVFDRTFAVTYLLEVVAVIIGLFGIGAGVSAQVLARRGEFGLLRHLGLTRAQIAATLALEGTLLGAVGVVVGVLSGVLVSMILIYVVNRQSFHWSMDLSAPSGLLLALSGALIACSALIAVFSGRQAMRGEVVRAVREDW